MKPIEEELCCISWENTVESYLFFEILSTNRYNVITALQKLKEKDYKFESTSATCIVSEQKTVGARLRKILNLFCFFSETAPLNSVINS